MTPYAKLKDRLCIFLKKKSGGKQAVVGTKDGNGE
jgi:hypothetical protein